MERESMIGRGEKSFAPVSDIDFAAELVYTLRVFTIVVINKVEESLIMNLQKSSVVFVLLSVVFCFSAAAADEPAMSVKGEGVFTNAPTLLIDGVVVTRADRVG